jgi:methylmalonyl-CoA mutase cobalamin-binding subunit
MELTSATDIKRPLQETLSAHVIPKLLGQTGVVPHANAFTDAQCEALAQACVSAETVEVERCARRFLALGLGIEGLFLGAIPTAARLFHDWWAEDRIDFVDVTRGTFQLEELVYTLSTEFVLHGPAKLAASGFKALLVNTPGSHHSLGLLILSQYFKRYGWHVYSHTASTGDDLLTAVRTEWVDLVGISVSDQRQFDNLARLIRSMRQQARNRALRVMVGGPALRFEPQLATLLGADVATYHADDAHTQALALVKQSLSTRQGA